MTDTSVDIHKKRAGLLLPLSALRNENDCGLGEIGGLEPLLDWMCSAGLGVLQVLPLNDLAPLDSCPYCAVSAFALDAAAYITLQDVPEVRSSPALASELQAAVASGEARRLRASRRARFAEARAFKSRFLEAAFHAFEEREWEPRTPRAGAFEAFVHANREWIEDYALFRVLKEWTGWESWTRWPAGLRSRDAARLAEFRERHARRVRFYQYLQWLAFEQWARARRLARERGILLFGDIPFGLNLESADVWARQDEFDFSAAMGAPPDQFSATGQSWDLPAYRWDRMEAGGHIWWRMRVRHAASLYELFRLDHAVGLFRTWVIPKDGGAPGFDVKDEPSQRARGERFFRMVLEEAGASRPVAEDLGVIPPFVREVLAELGVPGYKVTRWERRGDGFWHPQDFPRLSVATPGNHDTSTLVSWWREISELERDRYWEMVTASKDGVPSFSSLVHEKLIENVYRAGSALAVLSFQDVVASRVRVNVPGTVGPSNWTYRMPWPAERLLDSPRAAAKTGMLRRLAEATGRAAPAPAGGILA